MKTARKYKARPKNEKVYSRLIVFKFNVDYDEREAIIRRAIYNEQNLYKNKSLRWIVTEKDMEKAKIKFFLK